MIKRKGNKLYVKWKGSDSLSNSWIDKADIVIYNELYKNEIEVELDLANYAIKSDLQMQQMLIYLSLLRKLI